MFIDIFGNTASLKSVHEISCNMDVTILLPCPDLAILRANAIHFEKNGIEVILVAPASVDGQIIINEVIRYPFVNWKVLRLAGGSRDCIFDFVNTGLLQSAKRSIFVVDSGALFRNNLLLKFLYHLKNYQDSFFTIKSADPNGFKSFGGILIRKEHLNPVGGFEKFSRWEDGIQNFVRRLQRAGLKQRMLDEVLQTSKVLENDFFEQDSVEFLDKEVKYPSRVNFPVDSCQFTVDYDWKECSLASIRCCQYLKSLIQFDIVDKSCFEKSYELIALIQTHNERKHFPEVLKHLDSYCDGIILLDDESNDGTYEAAFSEKLIIKAQKKRVGFDDLANRNELLNIVSFFRTKWIFFIDADERFDRRYANLREIIRTTQSDVISFWVINLWDSVIKKNKQLSIHKIDIGS